jgi:hypothetical protein
MYQVSRAMYRELSPAIVGGRDAHERVLHACETTVERLVADRHYFAHPARFLFGELRVHFGIQDQPRVRSVVERYVRCVVDALERLPRNGLDANGNPLQCRATTRRGTPCQRMPLHDNGYCPSHQHLAETEGDGESPIGAPIAA